MFVCVFARVCKYALRPSIAHAVLLFLCVQGPPRCTVFVDFLVHMCVFVCYMLSMCVANMVKFVLIYLHLSYAQAPLYLCICKCDMTQVQCRGLFGYHCCFNSIQMRNALPPGAFRPTLLFSAMFFSLSWEAETLMNVLILYIGCESPLSRK